MRLSAALLVYFCLLFLVCDSKGRCRKKRPGKKCDKQAIGAPRWRRRSKETNLVERELSSVVLKCQVRSNPRPKYRWYRDGKILQKSKKYRRKKYKLIIHSLQLSDSGKYTCHVFNSHGSLNRTYTLTVLGYETDMTEFSIKDRPRNQTAQVGDSVVFRCSTDSFPRPTLEWSMKKTATSKVDIQLQKASDSSRAEMLVLDDVTKDDAGLYTCTMKNRITTRHLTAQLVVIEEGEELPFEPKCALHVRKQILYDDVYGCHTQEAVKITYCMGSCGRSYYLPTLVASSLNTPATIATPSSPANQTCQCCVGQIQGIQVVTLRCPSGDTINAFFTTLRGCTCRNCHVEGGWGWA